VDKKDQAARLPVAGSPFSQEAFPRILSTAALIHHKGLHDYLKAVTRLVKDFPKLEYTILGAARDPKYAAFLRQTISALGMERHVRIRADATQDQKTAAFCTADLYVQPSHEEGFCLAFLEAAATVPRLLGTRTGAIMSIAGDGPDAAVVPPRDVRALEDATRRLLLWQPDPGVLLMRRDRIRSEYSWDRLACRHIHEYEKAIKRT